jgi:predicted secreted protein
MTAPVRLLSIACVAWLFQAATLAQSAPPKSLAEMAAQAKARKTGQPHVVLDDESIQSHKAPIPDITTGTADNIDEILKAIGEFRKAHTRAETEQVVHDWYDKHDSLLAKATSENQRIGERESARQSVNGYGYQSYREAQSTYESDARAAREDYQRIRENAILANKIQQSLTKIRSQLRSQGMDFEWFKLRCGNTYCNQ